MNKVKINLKILLFCSILSALATGFPLVFTCTGSTTELLLGSPSEDRFRLEMAAVICDKVAARYPDLDCQVVEVAQEEDLIADLLKGDIDLALSESLIIHDALRGSGHFTSESLTSTNLVTITPLYDVPITLLARKNFAQETIATGREIWLNTGRPLSTEERSVKKLLEMSLLAEDDFKLHTELPQPESLDAMAYSTGNIKAMVHKGLHPDPALASLMNMADIEIMIADEQKLLGIIEDSPEYVKTTIPPGVYDAQEQAVDTLGTRTYLITTTALDHGIAYLLAELLDNHKKELQKYHPGWKDLEIRALIYNELPTFTHPGAAKYFSNSGHSSGGGLKKTNPKS